MKILIFIVFCNIVSGFPSVPGPQKIGSIIKGPGSLVIIEGPDGSVIKADAIGGLVLVGDLVPAGELIPVVSPVPTEGSTSTEASISTSASTNDSASNGSESTSESDATEASSKETDETPLEITTAVNEDLSTPAIKSKPDVEVVEPITQQPPIPPIDKNVELEGRSGKISVNGFGAVVAGPDSALVKKTGAQTKVQKLAKQVEAIRTPFTDAAITARLQQQFIPKFYGGFLSYYDWDNLVAPGFPIGVYPLRFIKRAD